MKKQLFALFSAALLLAISVSAQAVVVTDWDYTVDGAFVQWTDTNGVTGDATSNPSAIVGSDAVTLSYAYDGGAPVPSFPTPETQDGYRTLSWGTGPQSSIDLDPGSGSMVTNGSAEMAMTMTHDNFSIPSSDATLDSGIVRATLALTPTNPAGSALPVFSTVLEFAFFETLNVGGLQNDVFVLLNPEATVETFTYDGQAYQFTFEGSFGTIPQEYVDLLNLDAELGLDSYVGWVTTEGETTVVPTFVAIETVPEPATIALFGLGLLGLGFFRRRKA